MEPVSNYWLLWGIYLTASAIFFTVFWPMTRFRRHQWLGVLLRCTMLVCAFTPWYANQEGSVLAPALIVVLLDAITIGGAAPVRALVPLFLTMLLAWILAGAWLIISKKLRSKGAKNQNVTSLR